MASSNNVELKAANFLHKLIQDSKDEPAKLASKLQLILQDMKLSGKENSMPFQVISRAMEIVISQHGLDIEALKSSRLPVTGGPQIGSSSSQAVGSANDARVGLAENEASKMDPFISGRPPIAPTGGAPDYYQGSMAQRSSQSFDQESPSSLDSRSANSQSQDRRDTANLDKQQVNQKAGKKATAKRKRGGTSSPVELHADSSFPWTDRDPHGATVMKDGNLMTKDVSSEQEGNGILSSDLLSSKKYTMSERRIMDQQRKRLLVEQNAYDAENVVDPSSKTPWVPPCISVDVTHLFTTNQVFDTRDDLIKWARDVGKDNGYVLVITRSDMGGPGKLVYVTLMCERHGVYKPYKDPAEFKYKKTCSKKCACPFRLKGRPIKAEGGWRLKVKCGLHNHESNENLGHSYAGRLSKEEKTHVETMTKNGVAPRNMLASLKERDPENVSTITQVYTVSKMWRKAKRGPLTDKHTSAVDALQKEFDNVLHLYKNLDDAGQSMIRRKMKQIYCPESS